MSVFSKRTADPRKIVLSVVNQNGQPDGVFIVNGVTVPNSGVAIPVGTVDPNNVPYSWSEPSGQNQIGANQYTVYDAWYYGFFYLMPSVGVFALGLSFPDNAEVTLYMS